MADFDIVVLIRSEHEQFRRAFTELESVSDASELTSKWRELADSLEVHAAGEEEVFYPELLSDLEDADLDAEGETKHAVKDHNEIREACEKVDAEEVGTDAWWEALRNAREVTVDHLDEEEQDMLPDYQSQADEDKRGALGMKWMEFHDKHEGAKGLNAEHKDPDAYVEQNT